MFVDYETEYWCRTGSHKILKHQAIPQKDGRLICPIHRRMISSKVCPSRQNRDVKRRKKPRLPDFELL